MAVGGSPPPLPAISSFHAADRTPAEPGRPSLPPVRHPGARLAALLADGPYHGISPRGNAARGDADLGGRRLRISLGTRVGARLHPTAVWRPTLGCAARHRGPSPLRRLRPQPPEPDPHLARRPRSGVCPRRPRHRPGPTERTYHRLRLV